MKLLFQLTLRSSTERTRWFPPNGRSSNAHLESKNNVRLKPTRPSFGIIATSCGTSAMAWANDVLLFLPTGWRSGEHISDCAGHWRWVNSHDDGHGYIDHYISALWGLHASGCRRFTRPAAGTDEKMGERGVSGWRSRPESPFSCGRFGQSRPGQRPHLWFLDVNRAVQYQPTSCSWAFHASAEGRS